MSEEQHFELADLVNRPGMYYSPQTEVLIVVDDSPELDNETLSSDEFEGAEWILIADEIPIDEHQRDGLVERFTTTYHPGSERVLDDGDDRPDDEEKLDADELEGEEDEQEDYDEDDSAAEAEQDEL